MEKENIQENDSKENKNIGKGGVYQIQNKINGKIYIGSSNNMEKRWYEHRRVLMKGEHVNTHMQNCVNKIKEEMEFSTNILDKIFYFGCIEYEDDLEKRLAKEDEYIKLLFDNGKMCYNQSKDVVWKERPFSTKPEHTRKKLSIAGKLNWTDPDFRERMCLVVRETVKTENWKQKMSLVQNDPEIRRQQTESKIKNGIIKPFCIISDTGKVFYIEILSKWSKKNEIGQKALCRLRDSETIKCKGFKLFMSSERVREENEKFSKIVYEGSLCFIKRNIGLYILSPSCYKKVRLG